MKKLVFLLCIIPIVLKAQVQPSLALRAVCDRHYIENMRSILVQFSGFTDKKTLKTYQNYMLIIKAFDDLGYTIINLDFLLNSEQRTKLRTPMERYSRCQTSVRSAYGRGVGDLSLASRILTPCDRQYAIAMQDTLNYYTPTIPKDVLARYEDFMVLLKQHEDYRFMIHNFEALTPTDKIVKLRSPHARYNRCRTPFVQRITRKMS